MGVLKLLWRDIVWSLWSLFDLEGALEQVDRDLAAGRI